MAQVVTEGGKFEQMGTLLPTPNIYRSASGAPGFEYWQQRADYRIDVILDDDHQRISGYEEITYYNNSPDPLSYLWLQLDQNIGKIDSDNSRTRSTSMGKNMSGPEIRKILGREGDLGFEVLEVKSDIGSDLPFTINKTMMRIDLPVPLGSKNQVCFSIRWEYNINDRQKDGGRSGFEFFEADGNYQYNIAQFFPRMAVYDDINGWQHKQFLGRGEFALPFGNYQVNITVPADHIVGATGVLDNPHDVLTAIQIDKLMAARTASEPVIIVSQEEAERKEASRVKESNTWQFHADSVRDFAFVSSRKLIWDAMGVKIGDKTVMAMSLYPKEANPLYGKYSTKVVAHTLKFYSDYTVPYPYPTAISVGANGNGMEYPMIAFNYGRPNANGIYSDRLKQSVISVIIHETGHNFFPMIINSDERQWTWMDEGLNSFVQYLAEKAWDPEYPSRRGPPENIIPYMQGDKEFMVPIMTNPEQLKQYANNAYGKPATALNILRETIMGRALFDHAFREYCKRWAFKHPAPADFFRTMEDASAIDLDWFWKGWFYTTDHVDQEIRDVTWYKYGEELREEGTRDQAERLSGKRSETNLDHETLTPSIPKDHDLAVEKINNFTFFSTSLSQADERLKSNSNFYELKLANNGGLIMPVILKFSFSDGTSTVERLPAEIWRNNEKEVSKVFVFDKEIEEIELDPYGEIADVDVGNNFFPPRGIPGNIKRSKGK